MSKITKRENHRVIVEPWVFRHETDDKYILRKCEEIMAEIKRHVDNIGHVWVEVDTKEVCSFCGYGWELDDETGEPMCCTKAIEEFNNEKAKNESPTI